MNRYRIVDDISAFHAVWRDTVELDEQWAAAHECETLPAIVRHAGAVCTQAKFGVVFQKAR